MSTLNQDLDRYSVEPNVFLPPSEPSPANESRPWIAPPFEGYLLVGLVLTAIAAQPLLLFSWRASGLWLLLWIFLPLPVIGGMIAAYRFHGYRLGRTMGPALVEKRRRAWLRQVEELSTRYAHEAKEKSRTLRELLVRARDCRHLLLNSLDQASSCLSRAAREYDERAFAPFWDAVEEVVANLGRYQAGVRELASSADAYSSGLRGRRHNFPPFPYQARDVPAATDILNQLRLVVRRGQTDFEFATIWEQRKTRETINTGFGSLEAAVREVGASVTVALQQAQGAFERGLAEVAASSTAIASEVARSADQAAEVAEVQRKELVGLLEKQDGKLEDILSKSRR